MSVRSFHSVYMAGTIAAAALGCYLVSLRVASERAALDGVETRIVQTQADIRMLQTEIGTRGRLDQLEQWNASALSLSAPAANQFMQDSFQLAKLAAPDHRLDVKAPVVMASAPAPQPQPVLGSGQADETDMSRSSSSPQQLVHEASLKVESRENPLAAAVVPASARTAPASKPIPLKSAVRKSEPERAAATKAPAKRAVPKLSIASARAPAKVIRLAEADPLAPLPFGKSRAVHSQQSRDNGRTK